MLEHMLFHYAAHKFAKKAKKWYDDSIREEAFEDGMRAGGIEVKKKLATELEKSENGIVGAYALAVYIANLDGQITEAEAIELDRVAGDLSKYWQREGLINKLKAVYDEKPSFKMICKRYFSNISQKALNDLNVMVLEILNAEERADGSSEDMFYNDVWLPFFSSGGNMNHSYSQEEFRLPKCSICGDAMKSWREDNEGNKYCSEECFKETWPKCAICGRPMQRWIESEGKKYCNDECYKLTWPKCVVCGKHINEWLTDSEGNKYCSERCHKQSWPKCYVCGRPMNQWLIGANGKKYCCESCYDKKTPINNKKSLLDIARSYIEEKGIDVTSKKGFSECLKLAEAGNDEAKFIIAKCYKDGIGTSKDAFKAYRWYKQLAKKGNADAMFSIGKMYDCYMLEDDDDEEDERAFEWYMEAAELGHPEAAHKVADCYYYGNGTDEDEIEAEYWYDKAKELGYDDNKSRSSGGLFSGLWIADEK